MEAKDTIINTNTDNCHNTLEERLAEQAKVSFRAGMLEVLRFYCEENWCPKCQDYVSTVERRWETSIAIIWDIECIKCHQFLARRHKKTPSEGCPLHDPKELDDEEEWDGLSEKERFGGWGDD